MGLLGQNVMAGLTVAADAMRRADWERAECQPPTVQGLIDMLHPYERETPDAVVYVFGEVRLDGFIDSYRGYYDHLCLGYVIDSWENEDNEVTVEKLIGMLNDAIGRTFTGYKGGDFTMGPRTPVWLANYGKAAGGVITGISDYSDEHYLWLDVRMVAGLHGDRIGG